MSTADEREGEVNEEEETEDGEEDEAACGKENVTPSSSGANKTSRRLPRSSFERSRKARRAPGAGRKKSESDKAYHSPENIGGPELVDCTNQETPRRRPASEEKRSPDRSTVRSFVKYVERCSSCSGSSVVNRSKLTKSVYKDSSSVLHFKDDDTGELFYAHVRFPEQQLPLSNTAERTLRRRVEFLEQLVGRLVNEVDEVKRDESMAKMLVALIQRNPRVKEHMQHILEEKDTKPLIDMGDALPLLTRLTCSKSGAENMMSAINRSSIRRVFGSRANYRIAYAERSLGARYESRTVTFSVGDNDETVDAAMMINIPDVLHNYIHRMQKHLEISDNTEWSYQLRLGLDKGGAYTKLSLSFANSENNQSPYSNITA